MKLNFYYIIILQMVLLLVSYLCENVNILLQISTSVLKCLVYAVEGNALTCRGATGVDVWEACDPHETRRNAKVGASKTIANSA